MPFRNGTESEMTVKDRVAGSPPLTPDGYVHFPSWEAMQSKNCLPVVDTQVELHWSGSAEQQLRNVLDGKCRSTQNGNLRG